jgi:uncharacterized protein YbaP (TraB family)
MAIVSAAKWWKFTTIVIAVLFVALPDAHAEGAPAIPECHGRDLLADLALKNPHGFDRWVAAARQVPNGQALFWRISRKTLREPSWLLGTAHITDPRILALPPETNDAFEKARILVEELPDLDKPWSDFFNNLFALPSIYLPDGKTWRDYLSETELQAMAKKLGQYGYSISQFERQQPWVTGVSLFNYPNCEAWRLYLGKNHLDADLADRARRAGKPVVGLQSRYEAYRTIAKTSLEAQFRTMLGYSRIMETPED